MNKKGFGGIVLIIVAAVVLGIGGYLVSTSSSEATFAYAGYSFNYPSSWQASLITYGSPAMEAEGKPRDIVGFTVKKSQDATDEYTISLGGNQAPASCKEVRDMEWKVAQCADLPIGALTTFGNNAETLSTFDQIVRTLAKQ